MDENGNAKLLKIIDEKIEQKFQSVESQIDILIHLGRNNMDELRNKHQEILQKLQGIQTEMTDLKEEVKTNFKQVIALINEKFK